MREKQVQTVKPFHWNVYWKVLSKLKVYLQLTPSTKTKLWEEINKIGDILWVTAHYKETYQLYEEAGKVSKGKIKLTALLRAAHSQGMLAVAPFSLVALSDSDSYANVFNARLYRLGEAIKRYDQVLRLTKPHTLEHLQATASLGELLTVFQKGIIDGVLEKETTLSYQNAMNVKEMLFHCCPWQNYRSRLQQLRADLNEVMQPTSNTSLVEINSHEIFQIQRQFSQAIIQLLNEIFQTSLKRLGKPPVPFALFGLGSLSRLEMAPYSDVECGLVVSDDYELSHECYFMRLLVIWESHLQSLGEYYPTGLHLDREGNPRVEGRLFGKASTIASQLNDPNYSLVDDLNYSLQYPRLIYASKDGETVFQSLKVAINTHQQLPYRSKSQKGKHRTIKLPAHTITSMYQARALTHMYRLLTDIEKKEVRSFALYNFSIEEVKQLKSFEKSAWENLAGYSEGLFEKIQKISKENSAYQKESFSDGEVKCIQLLLNQNNQKELSAKLLEVYKDLRNFKIVPNQELPVKSVYLAILQYLTWDLATFYGLFVTDCQQALKMLARHHIASNKKPVLAPSFVRDLRQALASLMVLRYRIQLKSGCQKKPEVACLTPHPSYYVLSPEDRNYLAYVYRRLLQPFYHVIHHLSQEPSSLGRALSTFEDWDPLLVLIKSLVADCKVHHPLNISRSDKLWLRGFIEYQQRHNMSFQTHLAIYRHLPTAYRNYYRNVVCAEKHPTTSSLLFKLNHFPNAVGKRITTEAMEKAWKQVQQMLYRPSFGQKTKAIPWITISATPGQNKTLPVCFAEQLVNQKGQFKQSDRNQLDGRRIVIPIKDHNDRILCYAKAYPERAGVHLAVQALALRISGYGPQSTLYRFQPRGSKAKEAYPVLLSQPKGKSLQHLSRNSQQHEILKKLDPYFFTLKVAETLIIHPQDDKADNLTLEPFKDGKGEVRYRIVSIDPDHAFGKALEDGPKHKVQLKTVIFCMDLMESPLDPCAVKALLTLNPVEFLTDWLKELENINQQIFSNSSSKGSETLFTKHSFKCKQDSCFLPVEMESGTVSALLQRFIRLQATLCDEANPIRNHFDWVSRLLPRLASYYREVFEQARKELPMLRFSLLTTDYQSVRTKKNKLSTRARRSLTMTDKTKFKGILRSRYDNSRSIGPREVLEELKAVDANYQQFNYLLKQIQVGSKVTATLLPELKEKLLAQIFWDKLNSEAQKNILTTVKRTPFYRLLLVNCGALTDDWLKQTAKSMPDLQVLDVSGCMNITEEGIIAVFKQCRQLREFYATGCHQLSDKLLLGLMKYARALETLVLAGTTIQHFTITEQVSAQSKVSYLLELRHLDLSQCKQLKIIFISVPQLLDLNLSGCSLLTDIDLLDNPKVIIKARSCSGHVKAYAWLKRDFSVRPRVSLIGQAEKAGNKNLAAIAELQLARAIENYVTVWNSLCNAGDVSYSFPSQNLNKIDDLLARIQNNHPDLMELSLDASCLRRDVIALLAANRTIWKLKLPSVAMKEGKNFHPLIKGNRSICEVEIKERMNFYAGIKIAVLNESKRGCSYKSALISHFVTGDSLDADFFRRRIKMDDTFFELEVTNNTGQEEYTALLDQYMLSSNAFILIFDLHDRETFEDIPRYIHRITHVKEKPLSKIPFLLIGCVRKGKAVSVTKTEIDQLQIEVDASYVELDIGISGDKIIMDRMQVEDAFKKISKRYIKLKTELLEKEIKPTTNFQLQQWIERNRQLVNTLYLAVEGGHVESVWELLLLGVSPYVDSNLKSYQDKNLLTLASERGYIDVLKALLLHFKSAGITLHHLKQAPCNYKFTLSALLVNQSSHETLPMTAIFWVLTLSWRQRVKRLAEKLHLTLPSWIERKTRNEEIKYAGQSQLTSKYRGTLWNPKIAEASQQKAAENFGRLHSEVLGNLSHFLSRRDKAKVSLLNKYWYCFFQRNPEASGFMHVPYDSCAELCSSSEEGDEVFNN